MTRARPAAAPFGQLGRGKGFADERRICGNELGKSGRARPGFHVEHQYAPRAGRGNVLFELGSELGYEGICLIDLH